MPPTNDLFPDTKTKDPQLQIPPTDIIFREISLVGTNLYTSGFIAYNPDSLVGKKGLEIYQTMMIDDQIKAVLTMKKFARLMTPWSIEAASEDSMDKEIATFVSKNLSEMTGTFEDCLLNILTALEYGYSVTEELWYQIDKGEFAGKIGLRALKTRQPFYYFFDIDEHGNLRPDGVVYGGGMNYLYTPKSLSPTTSSWLTPTGQPTSQEPLRLGNRLPTNKFVIYSYGKEFSNWYGKSDLRSAYRSWWSKEILIRFMNIYMERFGMPTHVGKYPKGTKKTDRDQLKDILDKVQSKYSITIPDDVSIDLLQAGGAGESGYRTAIEMHNRFIARSILVPDLLGFTEASGGGSYALGKKHFDVFLWMLKKLGRDIEESIVGEQIIKRLVDLNYPNVENYPRFRFEDITEEGTQTKAMIIAAGIQGGFINPVETWIRRYLSLPEVEEGIQLGLPEQPTIGAEGPTFDVGEPTTDEDGNPEDKPEFEVGQPKESQVDQFTKALWKKYFARPVKRRTIIQVPYKYQKKDETKIIPTKFDKKLDYKKITKELDNYEQESVKALSEIVQKQKDALIKDIQKKQILEEGKLSEVNKIQLKFVGEFKKELENRIVKVYLDSKIEVLKELIDGDAPIELKILFQGAAIQNWEPVTPTEAIDFFNRKVIAKIVKKDGVKKVIDLATKAELPYYSAKAFAITGIEKDYILKQAKEILLAGIKNGDHTDAMFNLEELFNKYLETGELKDDVLVTPQRLELIVRQNVSEAMNAGRKEMMQHEDVKDFVPYVQYTAILDSRVRESHAEMSGRIYKMGDPILEEIWPPNGFACRCSMLPITVIDVEREGGVEVGSHKLPPDFPDEGFIKFSEDSNSRVKEYEEVNVPVTTNSGVDREELVKVWEEIVKGSATKNVPNQSSKDFSYEWVVKCPYRSCGSADIKPVKILGGALVYICNDCEHQFKVLQEGDVYFYDIGKEEWTSANFNMRPSYFSAELEGKKYYFTAKELLDKSIDRAKEVGIDISKIKVLEI